MLLRLEYQGKTLFEMSSAAMKEPIVIGRGSQCTWVAPSEDEFLGRRHAEISSKGKKVTIRDLDSRNGIFYQGERIKEKRLVVGDKIVMGTLSLLAENEVAHSKVSLKHRLTVKSGKAHGIMRDIPAAGSALTVGSDPSSGLLFLDSLISKHHAEIRVHADSSCWLQDMNSKNGTRVNGEPLLGGKERLLRCGDVLSFAHIDAVYTDGTENRAFRNTLIQGTVMVVCALILTAAYLVWKFSITPKAQFYIESAAEYEQKEQFDLAIEKLKKASDAPDYKAHQMAIQQRVLEIQRYQTISKGWRRVCDAIDGGDYVAANRELSSILSADTVDAWGWNEDSTKALPQAKILKSVLDQQSNVKALLASERGTGDKFLRASKQFVDITNELEKVQAVDVEKFMVAVNDDCNKLGQAISELRELEDALQELGKPAINVEMLARISKVVKGACNSPVPAVNARARLVSPAIDALYRGYDQYGLLLKAYQNLDWEHSDTIKVTPDEAGEFIKDPILSAARHQLADREKLLRACIREVRVRYRRIMKDSQWYAKVQMNIAYLEDPQLMTKVFACDSLTHPFPKRSRSTPCGEFDRIVGLEYFYDSLERLTTDLQVVTVPTETSWQPVMGELVDFLHEAENLQASLSTPDNRQFQGGEQAKSEGQLRELLKRRDAVRMGFLERMKQGGRGGLIAGVLAGLLSDPGFRVDGNPLWQSLMEIRRKLDGEVQALYTKYQSASIGDKIKLRDALLETGVPSHRLVKSMWAARTTVNGPRASEE